MNAFTLAADEMLAAYADDDEILPLHISEPISLGELMTTTVDPVSMGRQAWGRIKTNSKMMREDWRLVGEALLVGRTKFTTAGGGLNTKGFGQWCRENGFDVIPRQHRNDAMWLAENYSDVTGCDISQDTCHPMHIRQAYRELTAETTEPTTPLALPEPVKATDFRSIIQYNCSSDILMNIDQNPV